ncbi:uncharacterized protein LOC132673459 isoform X2 [Panthera onca]
MAAAAPRVRGPRVLWAAGRRDFEEERERPSAPPASTRGAPGSGAGGRCGPRAPPSPTRASWGGESRPGAEPLSPADPTEARAAARRTGIRDALPPPQLRRAPGHKFAPRWPSCEWGASPGSGVSVRLLARAGPGMAGPGASPHVWGWLLLGGCLLVGAQVEKFQQNGTTQREIHSSAGPTDVIVERHEVRRKYHILENTE